MRDSICFQYRSSIPSFTKGVGLTSSNLAKGWGWKIFSRREGWTNLLKKDKIWKCFPFFLFFFLIFNNLLIDFRIATYLKTGISQRFFWRILLIDFKTSSQKQFIKVALMKLLQSVCSYISCLLSSTNFYIFVLVYFLFFIV